LEWVVPLPEGLSLKEAMILRTAGFTAALSVQRLEDNGLEPGQGVLISLYFSLLIEFTLPTIAATP
jgi:NADPH:quinone reductase-like Zn-dependent oxidoreductase